MNPDLTVVPFVDPLSLERTPVSLVTSRYVSLRLVLVVGYLVGYEALLVLQIPYKQ